MDPLLKGGGGSGRVGAGLDHRSGDRVVMGSNRAGAASLRNFGNSVYPTLPVPFGRDTKRCMSLVSGVYARGSKTSHTGGECVTCRGLHDSEIIHSCVSPRMGCLQYITEN